MKTVLEIALWAGGAIVLVLVYWNVQYQRRLRKHQDMPRDSFLAYFADRGISAEVAAAVYDYYGSKAVWKTFGVSPGDEIAVLFNQEGDDTEEDFTQILKKLGLEMPYDSAWEARNEPLMRTVEDLVRALVWAGQNQPSAQRERTAGVS